MRFILVFKTHESSDFVLICSFIPCLVWVFRGKKYIPHRDTPHYLKGDLKKFLSSMNYETFITEKSMIFISDSSGQGANCDYLNLKQDLKDLGYDIKEISF